MWNSLLKINIAATYLRYKRCQSGSSCTLPSRYIAYINLMTWILQIFFAKKFNSLFGVKNFLYSKTFSKRILIYSTNMFFSSSLMGQLFSFQFCSIFWNSSSPPFLKLWKHIDSFIYCDFSFQFFPFSPYKWIFIILQVLHVSASFFQSFTS